MDVFFETQNGSKFSIELGYWDTVLEIKKKIEKYQRIPVPTQTLFFQGKALQDDLDIEKCNILHNSRVLVYVDHYSKPNHNSDQVLQTEQSLVPVRNNDQSPVINGHQDSTVTSQDLQSEQSPPSISPKESINIQDSSVDVRNKVKKIVVILSVLPYSGESNYTKNIMFTTPPTVQVKKLRSKSIQNELRGHINRPQDGNYFFVHKGRVLNEDQSFEWNSVAHTDTVEIIPDPWSSNKNQVPHQTEKSPPSKSVKGIPKLQDSPVKKRTMVVLVKSPYSSEGKAAKSILVSVNAMDEVTKLRDELVQSQQRGEINLPQDGYFLSHQKKVLNEDQSYEWNGVENMDTIVVVSIHVTLYNKKVIWILSN